MTTKSDIFTDLTFGKAGVSSDGDGVGVAESAALCSLRSRFELYKIDLNYKSTGRVENKC